MPKVENVVYAPQKPTPRNSQMLLEIIPSWLNLNKNAKNMEPLMLTIHVENIRLFNLSEIEYLAILPIKPPSATSNKFIRLPAF